MISVLVFIDDEIYDRALKKEKQRTKSKSVAIGRVGESLLSGILKSTSTSTTASGKADFVGVPVRNVEQIFKTVYSSSAPVLTKLTKELRGASFLDIEAKATEQQLGGKAFSYKGLPLTKAPAEGTISVTGATPSINLINVKDKDYLNRQKTLITEIVKLGLTNDPSSISKIKSLFDSLILKVDQDLTASEASEIEQQIYNTIGGSNGKALLQEAYQKIMEDDVQFKKFMEGPFGNLIYDKVRNLGVTVNIKTPEGKSLRFLQTFIGLKFKNTDIKRVRRGNKYSFSLTSAFENRLLEETRRKLLNNAIGRINDDLEVFTSTQLQSILGVSDSIENIVNSLSFTSFSIEVPTGGSIPLSFGIDATSFLNSINQQVPKILASNYEVAKTTKKGRFASTAQLTSLLRLEVFSRMKKAGKAAPPILTTRTGRFIENLDVVQVNYKNNVINYYSLPLYYSLEEYDYEVTDLIEGSLRAVTQKLYSRQFNLVRA